MKKLIADKESELEINEDIINKMEKNNKIDYEEIISSIRQERDADLDKIRDQEYELASKQLKIKDLE